MEKKTFIKVSFVFLILTVVALLAAIIGVSLSKSQVIVINQVTLVNEEVCTTPECVETANYLFASLNESVNPCDDFYEFSCGGWIANNPRPADESYWSADGNATEIAMQRLKEVLESDVLFREKSLVINKAQRYYRACNNSYFSTSIKDDLNEFNEILNEIGGFPLINDNWQSDGYDYVNAFLVSDLNLQVQPFFQYTVKNNEIKLESSALLFGKIMKEDTFDIIEEKKAKFWQRTYLKIKHLKSSVSKEYITTELDKVLDFELKLLNLTMSDDEETEEGETNTEESENTVESEEEEEDDGVQMSIKEMQKQFPKIDWLYLFQQLFKSVQIEMNENSTIFVSETKYFEKLGEFLETIEKRIIANYVALNVIEDFGSVTLYKFRKIDKSIKSSTGLTPICVAQTEEYFNLPLGFYMTKKYISNDAVAEVKGFLDAVTASLTHTLQSNDWMDDDTRSKAQLKLNKMMKYVAIPSWLVTEKDLNTLYSNLGFISSESFVITQRKVFSWFKQIQLLSFNSSSNVSLDLLDIVKPSDMNAYNTLGKNEIIIQMGFIYRPQYYQKAPLAINFGSMATTIGHEILHGFDNDGSTHDHRGKRINWWKKKSKQIFQQKVQCFIEQYSNFTEPKTGLNINGEETVGENIADNGGVYQAFTAYKTYAALVETEKDLRLPSRMKKFTKDQLFFIAYGNTYCENHSKEYLEEEVVNHDEHSPNIARVIIPLRNMDYFSKAFNCSIGSKMNPIDKCILW